MGERREWTGYLLAVTFRKMDGQISYATYRLSSVDRHQLLVHITFILIICHMR
jgi:hypothetical protein